MTSKIPNPAEADRLDSWKEIASYVGRDVRTAIRWERERGLPVHRLPGGRRGMVFAYRAEIDRWLRNAAAAEEQPPGGPLPQEAAPGGDANGGRAAVSARPARRPVAVLGGVLAAALLLVVGVGASWYSHRAGPRAALAMRIDRLDLEARAVVARAEDGSVAWRHELANRTAPQFLSNSPWYAVADVDGDGRAEVAASVPQTTGDGGFIEELHLFSDAGKLRWRQSLQDRFTFGAGSFGPPWLAGHVAVVHVRGEARIAWGIGHHTWWPGVLAVLDKEGRRLGTFVHAGSIRSVSAFDGPGGPFLLAGGVSNAYRAAFMAVLDAAALSGQGPTPPGSPFACAACGAVVPRRYFVFPPSDIPFASGMPYNSTRSFLRHGDEVEALTSESAPGAPVAEMIFRFNRDFDLLEARASDSWPAHETLEKAGKLDHGVAQCPWYLNPPPVREWIPPDRWVELRPGAAASPLSAASIGPSAPGSPAR